MLFRFYIFVLAICVVAFADDDDCNYCETQMLGTGTEGDFNTESLTATINAYCDEEGNMIQGTRDCSQTDPKFSVHICCIRDAILIEPEDFQENIVKELVALGIVEACLYTGCDRNMCSSLDHAPTLKGFLHGLVNEDAQPNESANTAGVTNLVKNHIEKNGIQFNRFLQLGQSLRKHQKKGLIARTQGSSTAQAARHMAMTLVTTWMKMHVEAGGSCTSKSSGSSSGSGSSNKHNNAISRSQYYLNSRKKVDSINHETAAEFWARQSSRIKKQFGKK